MALCSSRKKLVTFRLTVEEYEALRSLCIAKGVRSISELTRDAVLQHLSPDRQPQSRAVGSGDLCTLISALEHIDDALKDLGLRISSAFGPPGKRSMSAPPLRLSSRRWKEGFDTAIVAMEDRMRRSITWAWQLPSVGLLLIPVMFADSKPAAGTQSADGAQAPYLLHADDEITVHSVQAKEIADKAFRLDQNGEVNFPMAGVVHLGGNTVRDAEKNVAAAFRKFYLEPDIAINVTAFHSEPVSVLGSVGAPSVYQLKGQTRLLDALSAAGGTRPDAGPTVTVTRQPAYGPIPHHDARQMLSGESVVEIDLKSLMEGRDSADNFLIEPHDVISIAAAQFVYVLGNVKRAGGFALGGRPAFTVLDALALSEGADPRAALNRATILRRGPGEEQLIPVDIKKILSGMAEDVVMRPNDVLFVPNNTMKTVTTRIIESAIQIGTGILIFRQ